MMVTDHGGKDVKNNFFSLCVLCVCLLLARSTIALLVGGQRVWVVPPVLSTQVSSRLGMLPCGISQLTSIGLSSPATALWLLARPSPLLQQSSRGRRRRRRLIFCSPSPPPPSSTTTSTVQASPPKASTDGHQASPPLVRVTPHRSPHLTSVVPLPQWPLNAA